MIIPLRTKFKLLMPFLASSLYVMPLMAGSGHSNVAPAVTATNLYVEDFTWANGTTADNSTASTWTTVYTGPGQVANRFSVAASEFRVNNITVNGVGTWTSGTIDISGKTNITIAVDIRSGVLPGGVLDNDNSDHYDYLQLYYKIDNNAPVLYSDNRGAINSNSTTNTNVVINALSGSNLQVIIKARATATDEFYYFDNVVVSGTAAVTVDASAGVSGILSCSNTVVNLQGSSATPGVTYSWTGPGGFNITQQNPAVNTPGTYTLTVTDAGNNTATASVTVTQNVTLPTGVSATNSNIITCYQPSTQLTGTSVTPGATYLWTGPGGFSVNTVATSTQSGGVYTFVVTDPVNGCTASATVTVVQNNAAPVVTVSNNGPLSCTVHSVTVTGSSTTPGADFFWTGPNDFIGFSDAETVTDAGEYVLTVTNLDNGCATSLSTTVAQDVAGCLNGAVKNTAMGSIDLPGDQAAGFMYKAYPNPGRGRSFIEFSHAQAGPATISLYNSLGVREKVLFNQTVAAGQVYKVVVNADCLPGGLYYAVLTVNNKTYTKQITFIK